MSYEKNIIPVKRSFKIYVIVFWTLFSCGIGSMYFLFFGIANWNLMGELPPFEDLENPKTFLATELYSSDEQVIGTIFKENRSLVEFEELSTFLIDGLVSTEDERYYNHSGIDAKSLARAISKGGKSGGGSTITQQLAKMLFTNVARNKLDRIKQKLKEWVISVRLERHYTKNELLTMYFNKLDFVNNAAGIKSASKVYFNKLPGELEINEAAMFVGMAKNPSLFNPLKRPDTTLFRRNVVLNQMVRNNKLSKLEYDSLKLLPLGLKFQHASHRSGVATYFREEVRKQLKKIFSNLRKPDGTKYDIYRDGLKIYTSINYEMQKYAEKAVKVHIGSELQPAFYKHWKSKTRGLKKYAPFYFEDYTNKEKELAVNNLILRGIRSSGRYKKQLDRRPELRKRTYAYNRASYKNNRWKNKVKKYDDERHIFQQQLNLLNRDSSLKRLILNEKRITRNSISQYTDSVTKYKNKIKIFKNELEEKYLSYKALWKPFDDSMQVVFNQKIPMKIFTWEGEKDTLISPRDSVIHHKWFLRTGLLSIDPKTGFIKAWVGGINYKYFQYDHVRAKRQVGSTFKPFVYGTAIQNGLSPCDKILNEPVVFPAGMYGLEEKWSPENAAKSNLDGEQLTLKMALANSINSVTAKIMKDMGPQETIKFARACGITTPIEPVPSICLGTPDVSLFEMVSAYSVFANKGNYIEPQFIMRIEDKNGGTIWEPRPKRREAMTPENAYKMIELLSGVASYGPKIKGKHTYGTGVRLRSTYRPYGGIPSSIKIAGKTGTTQMQSDGWFMGITPDLVTGVWTGCEDRSAHFLSLKLGMGTNMALPIWGYYMKDIYKNPSLNISKGWFDKPESLKYEEFDCTKVQKLSDDEFEDR